jgi:hypothetical protein
MPLIATRGAASAQGFGEFAQSAVVNYIEEVFSTYLYTGTTAIQTITNGIDLSTKGGMVWMKDRSFAYNNCVVDSARGLTNGNILYTNTTNPAQTGFPENTAGISAFNTNGFTLRADANGVGTNYGLNVTPENYVSWTFRKQPKFFDIVTYTGNGTAGRTVAHNLGSTPGCIFVKKTSSADAWAVYHRGINSGTGNGVLVLNATSAQNTNGRFWWGDNTNFIAPTSTNFTVATDGQVNENGATYVAYLFAHDAGGFGLTGSDNVISCGSFTVNGSGNATVSLGYEPQWVMVKASSDTSNWEMYDSMRGLTATSASARLYPNLSAVEGSASSTVNATSTGFTVGGNMGAGLGGVTYIYIAIRRGPMKVPTLGTSVYTSASRTGTAGVMPRWVAGFPVDWALRKSDVTTGGGDWQAGDRLRGAVQVKPNLTEAETAASPLYIFDGMTGYSTLGAVGSDSADRSWMFRRAPGFFDEVCWSGDGVSNRALAHNLGVAPELIITKRRTAAADWQTYNSFTAIDYARLVLNTSAANTTGITYGFGVNLYSQPTSSNIYLTPFYPNSSGETFVAYLFATVAGVSKVGTYTGTAALLTVDCGFTSGARFVLIKRTNSTGDWYVWDSARGISSGNDPYLLLNTTGAEVTGTNYVDTDTTGFKVTAAAPAALNASGSTYIFLAIA